MALFEIKNNIDGSAIAKIMQIFQNCWRAFKRQPKGLLVVLAITILVGVGYFLYNHYVDKTNVTELQEQVQIINDLVDEKLLASDYQENLIYIITEIQLLQQEENQSYQDEQLELELLIAFIKKYHPNDPIISDLTAMQSRLRVNHDTYTQHYDYVMKQLNKAANDSIK